MNIGIWLGFPTYTPMKREGIGRFILYLTKYLIENYNIAIEIWIYEINRCECESLFKELLNKKKYKHCINIVSERNFLNLKLEKRIDILKHVFKENIEYKKHNNVSWKRLYKNYLLCLCYIYVKRRIVDYLIILFLILIGIGEKIIFKMNFRNKSKHDQLLFNDNLVQIANSKSEVDLFIVPIITLSNALSLKHRKIICLHDIVTHEFKNLFEKEMNKDIFNMMFLNINLIIETLSEHLLNEKIYFVSNCDYVRKNHTLEYIKNVKEELTDFVYLPVIIPDNIKKRIIKEEVLRDKYKIINDYIFFPTQVRPYKNLITLVKALKIVIDKGFSIQVVLTGKLENSKIASKYVEKNNLKQYIIETGDVSEEELYSLHKYAAATVVTSLFEGGFPWPALEGLFMDTPVIVPKIPVVIERLQSVGFNLHNCGLRLFEPLDYNELANEIIYSLRNRESIVTKQKPIKEVLLSYTWDDVAKKYYEIIQNKVLKS